VSFDDTAVMDAPHTGRVRHSEAGVCEECDPPKSVKRLAQHRYRVHGNGKRAAQDRPPSAPRTGPKLPTRNALKNDLTVTFTFVAQVVAMRDPVCGQVAMQQVPEIVAAWDSWAASTPAVRKWLALAMTGAGPIGVVLAHVPIFMIVAAHHGPQRAQYFPEHPPEDWTENGATPETGGAVPGAYAGGPVGSEYASENGAPPI
jgi:hypothetical protein